MNDDSISTLTPAQAEARRQEAMQLRSSNPIVQAGINSLHGLVKRAVDGFDPEKMRLENPTFPETLFRSCGFMDFFFGVVQDSEKYNFESTWIDIAGSATGEVNIIGPSGEVLFIVPPMYDTSVLKIGNYRRNDMIGEITSNFENRRHNSPVAANEYLSEALEAKLTNILSDKSTRVDEHREMLEKMYKYYGKRPVGAPSAAAQTNSSSNNIEDDFDIE